MSKSLRYIFAALALMLITAHALAASALTKSKMKASGAGEFDIVVDYLAPTSNQADIEAGVDGTRVYSVTLEWQSTGSIVYNAGNTNYVWNDSTLKYDGTIENKGWTIDNAKIMLTVKNRSNRTVDVECSQPKAINGVTVTGSYDKSTMNIPSAAPVVFTGIGTEQSEKAIYTVTDVSGDIGSDVKTIASITVTITGN